MNRPPHQLLAATRAAFASVLDALPSARGTRASAAGVIRPARVPAGLLMLVVLAFAAMGCPAPASAGGPVSAGGTSASGGTVSSGDDYLLAIGLDAGHDLARVAAIGGKVRWVGEASVLVETDRFGWAAFRHAGFRVEVVDHPVRTDYLVMTDHERTGLPAGAGRDAEILWRDGDTVLYHGVDPAAFGAAGATGHHHASRLPAELPLRSYLAHGAPSVVIRAMERAGGTPRPLTSRASLVGLEDRLRAHVHELSWNDTTETARSRHAFRTETRDHAAEYIRAAYLDALDGHGSVTFMDGFQCGHFDSTRDSVSIAPNVIATVPATGPRRGTIIVSAHYDAIASRTSGWDWQTDIAPGADDNATGVAATIEVLRLLAPLHFEFDLVAAAWACEEITPDALWGSRAYAESSVVRGDTILAVINMDMLGYNPDAEQLNILTNEGSQWIADLLLLAGAPPEWPGTVEKRIHLERPYSDHNSFWDRGIDAVTIDENENVRESNPNYHRVSDLDGTSRIGQVTTAVRMVSGALSALGLRPVPDLALGDGALALSWPGVPVDRYPDPGETVTATATIRNLGRSMDAARPVRVDFFTRDADAGERAIGSDTVTVALPVGGEATATQSWVVPAAGRGQVTFLARIAGLDAGDDFDASNNSASRDVVLNASAFSLIEAYAYPNPARDPADLRFRVHISDPGYVRITVTTLAGEKLGERVFFYETGESLPGVNEFGWDRVVGGAAPASGLYLAIVEAGSRTGEVEQRTVTFAFRR